MSDFSNGKVLRGRTAIITGASQGLGLEIATQYVAAGASVVICASDRDMLSRASETLKPITTNDQSVLSIVTEVSEPQAVDKLLS